MVLFTLLGFPSCIKKEKPLNLPPYSVGHIPFSEKLDNPEFKLCNDKVIIENGGRNASYKGGVKNSIIFFQPTIDSLKYIKGESGYLTVRFLMNCKGEKDRYRVLGINKRYKAKEFPESLTKTILDAVKEMKEWQVAEDNGEKYDGYNMLTFKIDDGQITDIIP